MTLDYVAAQMRERFTESRGAPVMITAEEWNAMSAGISIADLLEALLANPSDATAAGVGVLQRTRAGR